MTQESTMPVRMRPVASRVATLFVLAVVASCSSDDEPDAVDSTPPVSEGVAETTSAIGSPATEPELATSGLAVEVRPVIGPGATGGPPLEADALPAGAELLSMEDGSAIAVGPGGATEVFSEAFVIDTGAVGPAIMLQLDGQAGTDAFNAIAEACFNGAAVCPSMRLAIVFEGAVLTAPTVNAPEFRDEVQVTGAFTLAEAQDLADRINASGG